VVPKFGGAWNGEAMDIDLRQLDEHSGSISAEESIPFTDEFGNDTPILCAVDVSYSRSGSEYHFHGSVNAELNTSCHLCLEQVREPVDSEFAVIVRRGERRPSDSDDADETGDYITLSATQHEVSLDEHIREGVILSLPIKVVCREGCKGLCPTCGVNLNNETCNCEQAPDPRWDSLRALKRQSPDDPGQTG